MVNLAVRCKVTLCSNMGVAHTVLWQSPTGPALNQHVEKLIYLQFDLLQRSISKRPFNYVRTASAKGRQQGNKDQGSDILGRTLIPSPNQPPPPIQRTTPWCSGPRLAVLFGFTQTRGNMDVPHWGSRNPCEGRVLEWRLRMCGMCHHSAWMIGLPPSLWNELELLTFALGKGVRRHQ